jgi:hypothetical protein
MEPKRIFIILCIALIISIGLVSIGIAYAGGVRGMGLLGVLFFVTFGIIVVLAQIIPSGRYRMEQEEGLS